MLDPYLTLFDHGIEVAWVDIGHPDVGHADHTGEAVQEDVLSAVDDGAGAAAAAGTVDVHHSGLFGLDAGQEH